MPRTVDQWVEATTKRLTAVPAEMRKATAAQLVRGVQELQRTAPRRQGPRLVRKGPSLYHSIKVDRQGAHVFTDHPGAALLERGGKVSPTRGRYLVIPLRRAYVAGGRQFFALPERNGMRAVVPRGGGAPVAILARFVFVRARKWITRGVDVAEQGADERIADTVLPPGEL
jgi:hypothetical protein